MFKAILPSLLIAIAVFLAFPIQTLDFELIGVGTPMSLCPGITTGTECNDFEYVSAYNSTYFYLSDTFSHLNSKEATNYTYYEMALGGIAGVFAGIYVYRKNRTHKA